MTTRSRLTCVGAFLLASLVAGVAAAQPPVEHRTTLTFSGPVAVPGVTLPAGSYLFHMTDINSRHVIQVLSSDGQTAYAQFHAVEVWRNKVSGDPEVRFMETAADMPRAIRSFWEPLDSLGYEFMYPGDQKKLLLSGLPKTEAPILAVAPPAPAPIAPEPIVEPAPAPIEEEAVIEPAPVTVAEAAPAEVPAPVELPKTDSPTATLLLVGLGALLMGVFVHTMRTTMG